MGERDAALGPRRYIERAIAQFRCRVRCHRHQQQDAGRRDPRIVHGRADGTDGEGYGTDAIELAQRQPVDDGRHVSGIAARDGEAGKTGTHRAPAALDSISSIPWMWRQAAPAATSIRARRYRPLARTGQWPKTFIGAGASNETGSMVR